MGKKTWAKKNAHTDTLGTDWKWELYAKSWTRRFKILDKPLPDGEKWVILHRDSRVNRTHDSVRTQRQVSPKWVPSKSQVSPIFLRTRMGAGREGLWSDSDGESDSERDRIKHWKLRQLLKVLQVLFLFWTRIERIILCERKWPWLRSWWAPIEISNERTNWPWINVK